jgi:hypothetical protein
MKVTIRREVGAGRGFIEQYLAKDLKFYIATNDALTFKNIRSAQRFYTKAYTATNALCVNVKVVSSRGFYHHPFIKEY